jgi:hypothetical protein
MGMIDFWPEKKFERFFVHQRFPPFSESRVLCFVDPLQKNPILWENEVGGIQGAGPQNFILAGWICNS